MCSYYRFKRERMIKMDTRPYDKAYQQIIQFTQLVFLCVLLFFIYCAVCSILAAMPVSCILSGLCIVLFAWLLWKMQVSVVKQDLKKIPVILRLLIQLLRRLY